MLEISEGLEAGVRWREVRRALNLREFLGVWRVYGAQILREFLRFWRGYGTQEISEGLEAGVRWREVRRALNLREFLRVWRGVRSAKLRSALALCVPPALKIMFPVQTPSLSASF